MGAFIDLNGRRFGRLTIVSRAENKGRRTAWRYHCDCGDSGTVVGSAVMHAGQRSCGCLQREAASRLCVGRAVHGHAKGGRRSPTYSSWSAMIDRSTRPTHHAWGNYGGRGILVCDRWRLGEEGLSGFECFLEDMGERPAHTSIDRIDNSRNYEPSNCRWASDTQQVRNRRNVTMKPESVSRLREMAASASASVPELAKRFGISRAHAYRIISRGRWVEGEPNGRQQETHDGLIQKEEKSGYTSWVSE